MFTIKPKTKPKWYKFRTQLTRLLIWLANKIEVNEYTYAYAMEQMLKAQMDAMTYGTSAVKIQHIPFEELIDLPKKATRHEK